MNKSMILTEYDDGNFENYHESSLPAFTSNPLETPVLSHQAKGITKSSLSFNLSCFSNYEEYLKSQERASAPSNP